MNLEGVPMISPKEAQELTSEELLRAAQEEKRIDEELRGFEDQKTIYVKNLSRKVRDHLERKYEKAGWSVQQRIDEREGNHYFIFQIASPPPSWNGGGR